MAHRRAAPAPHWHPAGHPGQGSRIIHPQTYGMTTLGQIGRQPPANTDIAKIINNLTKNSPTQNWMIHKK